MRVRVNSEAVGDAQLVILIHYSIRRIRVFIVHSEDVVLKIQVRESYS